jgi:hypothetical protein
MLILGITGTGHDLFDDQLELIEQPAVGSQTSSGGLKGPEPSYGFDSQGD